MTVRAGPAAVLAALALLVAASGAGAQDTEPDEGPSVQRAEPVKKLRVMLLDLSALRDPKPDNTFVPPQRSYTHTFGSQRKSAEAPSIQQLSVNPEALEADVVVLQGVGDQRAARRLFPARDWRFLVARGAGQREAKADPLPAGQPTSAVALWLQQGVRFGGVDMSASSALGATLRITSGLGTLWVLSPAAACPSAASGPGGGLCRPLEDWVAAKLAAGDLVIVGGMLPAIGRTEGRPPAAAASVIPDTLAKSGAMAMIARRQPGLVQLSGADSGGRCGGDAQAAPGLHVRLARDNPPAIRWSGYLLPLEPPKAAPASDVRGPACALLLDIEVAQ